jgi:hypothetical protein
MGPLGPPTTSLATLHMDVDLTHMKVLSARPIFLLLSVNLT